MEKKKKEDNWGGKCERVDFNDRSYSLASEFLIYNQTSGKKWWPLKPFCFFSQNRKKKKHVLFSVVETKEKRRTFPKSVERCKCEVLMGCN